MDWRSDGCSSYLVDDGERFGHALQNPRLDGLTDDSDQLVRIAAGIAVAGDTGRRERSQAAWRVAGKIEIRAVGTGQEIVVHRDHRGDAAICDGCENARTEGLGDRKSVG